MFRLLHCLNASVQSSAENLVETPIFGRTDLRKGVSEAKFDVEADFDVKKSLTPPKSAENHEKLRKNREKVSEKKKSASKNRIIQIFRNTFS